MRTMHLTIGAAVAALGFSNLAQAQIPPAKPGQGAPSVDPSRIAVNPKLAIAAPAPGPNEGKVEVKILGGGKVHFLNLSCQVSGAEVRQTCSRNAQKKTGVALLAEPQPGHQFAGWSGDCEASGVKKACEVLVDSALIAIGASFTKNSGPMVTLTVGYWKPPLMGLRLTLSPETELVCTGGGRDANGVQKSSVCTAQFEQGSTITIKAEDSFAGVSPIDPKRWGDYCQGAKTAVCTVKMDQNRSVRIDYHPSQ